MLLHILIIERENQEVTICMVGIRKTETKSSQEKYLTFVHLERIWCLRWCCPSWLPARVFFDLITCLSVIFTVNIRLHVRATFAVSFTYSFSLIKPPSSEFKQVIQFCPDNIQWSQWYAQIVEKFVWVKMLVFTWICTAPNSTRIIFQFSTTESDLF